MMEHRRTSLTAALRNAEELVARNLPDDLHQKALTLVAECKAALQALDLGEPAHEHHQG